MRKNILYTLLMLAPFSAFCDDEYDGYGYSSEYPESSPYTLEYNPPPQTLDLFTTPAINVSTKNQPNSVRNPIIAQLFSQIMKTILFRRFASSNQTRQWAHYSDEHEMNTNHNKLNPNESHQKINPNNNSVNQNGNNNSPAKESGQNQNNSFFHDVKPEDQQSLNTLFTETIPEYVTGGQINNAVSLLVSELAPIIKTLPTPQDHPLAQLLLDPWETCILLSRKPGFGTESAETFLQRLKNHLKESALYQVFTMDENYFKALDNAVKGKDLGSATETLSEIVLRNPTSSTQQKLNPLKTLTQTILNDQDVLKNWDAMSNLVGDVQALLSQDHFPTRASQNLVPVVWACMAVLNHIKPGEIVDPIFPYQPSPPKITPRPTDPASQVTPLINQTA